MIIINKSTSLIIGNNEYPKNSLFYKVNENKQEVSLFLDDKKTVATNVSYLDFRDANYDPYASFEALLVALEALFVFDGTITLSIAPSVYPDDVNLFSGDTLTVVRGEYLSQVAISGRTYRWFRDGVAISGATEDTYTLTDSDIGFEITVEETVTNGAETLSAISDAVIPTSLVPFSYRPSEIDGIFTAGETLTVESFFIAAEAPTLTYQWRADGVDIPGATSQTYVVQAGDPDLDIDCVVTATNSEGVGVADCLPYSRFVFTMFTTANMRLPIENNIGTMGLKTQYDMYVDWGDGRPHQLINDQYFIDNDTSQVLATGFATGEYDVAFYGRKCWGFNGSLANGAGQDNLRDIKRWGRGFMRWGEPGFYVVDYDFVGVDSANTTSVFGWTNGLSRCRQLTNITATDIPDLSYTKSMQGFFSNCEALVSIPNLDQWDVSHIESFLGTFESCNVFNQNISNWDVSSGKVFYLMFINCTAFNQPLAWNMSSALDLASMFENCSAFDQDISSWNTSNVKSTRAMFRSCDVFNQNISAWDMSKVTNMSYMFVDCPLFNQPVNWTTTNLIWAREMFSGCIAFNQSFSTWSFNKVINLQRFLYNCTSYNTAFENLVIDNTASLPPDYGRQTNLEGFFQGCTSFNASVANWAFRNYDVGSSQYDTDMRDMFRGCSAFNQDLSSWSFNNGSQTTIGMFYDCVAFNSPLPIMKILFAESMFFNCSSFNQPLDSLTIEGHTANTFLANCTDFNQPIPQDLFDLRFNTVLDLAGCFQNCTSFNSSIDGLFKYPVRLISGLFAGCTAFNQSIVGLDTSPVLSISGTFLDCSSFDQDISSLDLTTINSASNAFDNSGLSTANYDALLNALASQNIVSNVTLGANGLTYSAAGEVGRNTLLSRGWIINGDSLV